jgi:enolase
MDAANSELWDAKKKKYVFHKSDGKQLTSDQLVKFWENWVKQYPIVPLKTVWLKMTGMVGHH